MSNANWSENAASVLHAAVVSRLSQTATCSVMLTGGRSALQLYDAWFRIPGFRGLSGVSFYFGDERCVPPNDAESNYGLAMRTLFREGVPGDCRVYRIKADLADVESEADRYALMLPRNLDVLLLGVGEDGHIASLFPHSKSLREPVRRVVPVVAPKPPSRRLTITASVIREARSVYVLAPGAGKAEVFKKARYEPDAIEALPARLALSGSWLLS